MDIIKGKNTKNNKLQVWLVWHYKFMDLNDLTDK